jgi:hypothetical protein
MHRFVSALQPVAGDLHFVPSDRVLENAAKLGELIPGEFLSNRAGSGERAASPTRFASRITLLIQLPA